MNSSFLEICRLFREQPEHTILKIEKKEEEYKYSFSDQPQSSIITALTLHYLIEIIGKNRFKRICQKPEININLTKIDQNTLTLTKDIVRKIFIGILDIQKEDLEEGFDYRCWWLINNHFRKLIFFNSFEEFENSLLDPIPKITQFKFDKAKTSGKGFEGLVERVYVSIQHHFKVIEENNKKIAQLRDIEMLTSRLADREMQVGSLIHLSDGYFYVDRIFVGGGAYVSILQDVEGRGVPKIICRGTALRLTATNGLMTGLNDILIEIGVKGIKTIWPELSLYLQVKQITSVKILGKSMGGAQAQALAVLIEGTQNIKVDELITYCSVGVGESINHLFKSEVLKNRQSSFKIQVIRNGGEFKEEIDYIPSVGGVHLGEGSSPEKCNIEVCYIQPREGEVGIYPRRIGFYHLIKNFLCSFSNGHCRQTTLGDFSWKRIDNRDEINKHLRTGNLLEKIRKCFAYAIHFLTLSLLNGQSFTSFFFQQKSQSL